MRIYTVPWLYAQDMEIDILATLVENFEKCPPLTNSWIRACHSLCPEMGKITQLGDFENQNHHKTVIFKIEITTKQWFWKSKLPQKWFWKSKSFPYMNFKIKIHSKLIDFEKSILSYEFLLFITIKIIQIKVILNQNHTQLLLCLKLVI